MELPQNWAESSEVGTLTFICVDLSSFQAVLNDGVEELVLPIHTELRRTALTIMLPEPTVLGDELLNSVLVAGVGSWLSRMFRIERTERVKSFVLVYGTANSEKVAFHPDPFGDLRH